MIHHWLKVSYLYTTATQVNLKQYSVENKSTIVDDTLCGLTSNISVRDTSKRQCPLWGCKAWSSALKTFCFATRSRLYLGRLSLSSRSLGTSPVLTTALGSMTVLPLQPSATVRPLDWSTILVLLVGEGRVEVELELRLELDGLLLLGELKPELEFSLPPASTWTLPLVGGEDGDIVALLVAIVTWLTREEDKGMFCFLKQIKLYIIRAMERHLWHVFYLLFLNKCILTPVFK